jgi:hypothetical protein
MSPYDVTPTYREVHNKFSVKYFLNLVLVDEEDRRYFKQQEITLYRKADEPPGAAAQQEAQHDVTPAGSEAAQSAATPAGGEAA